MFLVFLERFFHAFVFAIEHAFPEHPVLYSVEKLVTGHQDYQRLPADLMFTRTGSAARTTPNGKKRQRVQAFHLRIIAVLFATLIGKDASTFSQYLLNTFKKDECMLPN